ncbi:hypothetical protein HHK36_004225 [Tetracentron sinense]|uniref:Mitochondrial carrier protein n=1 Tax=Tetracentron sinense TaxID=13715 RepID=A0A834ZZZ7_TETSI|nr:hypothetical protein HHK36_004225 [Tetracentron sinense]
MEDENREEQRTAMDARISASLGLPPPNPNYQRSLTDFDGIFNHFNTLLSTPNLNTISPNQLKKKTSKNGNKNLNFSSTSISMDTHLSSSPPPLENPKPMSLKWLKPTTRGSSKVQALMRNLSIFERALIGAAAGGIAGAFTYVCLYPLDTIKTKLQTKGAAEIYSGTLDAIVKTFETKGILGFYSGVSAVMIGSTASSAVYFGTCEFGKSILSKFPQYPSVLIPPTAGAMGNIVSSAIMVPKELITQRMQAGAVGRSWEVLLRILEKDGVLGLYAGYSATLLRNLPAGVLSYSSFEYLKAAVISRTEKGHLEPFQSVCCGALAGAISASLTTPLDVVKTRLMTQVQGEGKNKVAVAVYSGISATVKEILKEEGWVGLTRGMGPRVLHSACFAALGYFAFETARLTLLHKYLDHKESYEMADAPA